MYWCLFWCVLVFILVFVLVRVLMCVCMSTPYHIVIAAFLFFSTFIVLHPHPLTQAFEKATKLKLRKSNILFMPDVPLTSLTELDLAYNEIFRIEGDLPLHELLPNIRQLNLQENLIQYIQVRVRLTLAGSYVNFFVLKCEEEVNVEKKARELS